MIHIDASAGAAASLWEAMGDGDHAMHAVSAGQALTRDISVDVAIIGGGYSGLNAAYALHKRGASAVVLDAKTVGWGASGRNGGVITSKFRPSFPRIAKAHGLNVARDMHRIAHQAVRVVESHVAEFADFGLRDARYEHNGSLRCAHTDSALAVIRNEAEWLAANLGDRSLSVLSRHEVAAETGSNAFVGGVLSTDAGAILPLRYVRGLAAGVQSQGVDIFEGTPVFSMDRTDKGVILRTPQASVNAGQVIIATNSYSNFTPATKAYHKTLVPFRSAMIATRKLTAEQDAVLMTQCRSYTETRRMMKWFRKVDGRILFGGRDAFGKEGQTTGFEALRRAMVELFPILQAWPIDYQWSGYVGMTFDALPHIGRADDRTTFCLGYNGAGIAMSSFLGQQAAALALGDPVTLSLLGREGLTPVPLHALRAPAVRMVAGWYQLLDALGA